MYIKPSSLLKNHYKFWTIYTPYKLDWNYVSYILNNIWYLWYSLPFTIVSCLWISLSWPYIYMIIIWPNCTIEHLCIYLVSISVGYVRERDNLKVNSTHIYSFHIDTIRNYFLQLFHLQTSCLPYFLSILEGLQSLTWFSMKFQVCLSHVYTEILWRWSYRWSMYDNSTPTSICIRSIELLNNLTYIFLSPTNLLFALCVWLIG